MTKDKVGIYVRLSRDEDRENYDSLLTQKDALTRYAKEHEFEIYDYYMDDNVSGYLFDERPEFNRMQQDLQDDKFEIVLSKDFSRIGRNNARTLLFLEKLQLMDKRIILPDENNFDSATSDDTMTGITTWFNEYYVKTTSKKIRYNLKEKQISGNLLVRSTFGYIKDENDLVVDHETAPIVREIFDLYKDGYGYRKIANIMNEKQYPTPSMADGTKRPTTNLWNATHISRILKNDIYTGVHNLRKTIRKGIKTRELIKIPEDEWIKIEDHHEAIISKKDFDYVQSVINNRNQKKIRAGTGKINLFAGMLFCHECGSPMFCIKNERFATHYQCGNYFKYGLKACASHRIMEKNLIVTILLKLKGIAKKIEETLSSTEKTLSAQAKIIKNYTSHIDKLSKDIENRKKERMVIYKDKVKGLIDEEMYLELVKELDVNIKTLSNQLEELQKLQDASNQSEKVLKSYLDIITEVLKIGLLNRENMDKLIVKIVIGADKKIKNIHWNKVLEPMVQ